MNYSKQREAIQKYLLSVKTHPTAETVYNELRKTNPDISLGTVYRNLDKLSKSGDILRLKGFGEKDRFDGMTKHHYHAKCIKCDDITDIFIDYMSSIDNGVKNSLGLDILSHDLKFNIICPKCK